jgi:hypothetical protein
MGCPQTRIFDGGAPAADFRLNPGLIEVHELEARQAKASACFALVHGRQLAQTDFGRYDHVGLEGADEAEERLRAPAVEPAGPG